MNQPLLIEVLYFDDCPHSEPALALVQEVAQKLAPGQKIQKILIRDEGEAKAQEFYGSPSIRINGRDIENKKGEASLTCRIYEGIQGTPPRWLVEAAFLRAIPQKHILFLCVANSARSQLAEGIARSLLPQKIKISSAGSQPTTVNPFAIQALAELGIDIRHHYSKNVETIDPQDVTSVITLCAEEVCPVFLGSAPRIHWGMPDPAGGTLDGFRLVRDELKKRLNHLSD